MYLKADIDDTKEISLNALVFGEGNPEYRSISKTAQYVNCAAANLALTRECTIASDQYKLLTWTQVPHRELPFRDKGGLRRQGQKRVLFVKDTT